MSSKIHYYPLTHPQQRIWYTEKFFPGTSIGNIAGTFRIKGALDYQLLEKTINIIIKENEALRLHIVEKDGKPMQYIKEYENKKIDFYDFSGYSDEEIEKWAVKQAQTPFILEDSELYYFAIIKINDNKTAIFMKIHHLVVDAWSIVQLTNKIIQYYNALKEGKEISLDNTPSYIDFIKSEQEYKTSERFQKDKEYWESVFDTVPEPATLRNRSTSHSNIRTQRKTYVLSADFTLKIRDFCKRNKTSIFIIFLSVLAVYINRTTENDDIVLGTPVLNRSNRREKDTVGMFVSTVPMRIKIQENINFKSFVKDVTRSWMGILRHQHYPYDLLLRDLRKKHKNVNNLYDILLSYQNAKFDKSIGNYHEGTWHFNGYQADSLYIHINDREDEGSLTIDYDYIAQVFNEKSIEYLHKHLTKLLEDVISNPDKSIAHLDFIAEDERQRVINVFNDTDRPYPAHKTMQQLFEEQVALNPDNVAVVFEDKQLTYSQLNERANQLARLLRRNGVKPDDIVGIMVRRSVEMIIGIMAIIKAGGCYLPIDPEYPIDRIHYMLKDSDTKVLLTEKTLMSRLNYSGIVIDVYNEEIKKECKTNLEIVNKPNDLVYVIYTSGSTGNPKAVMIEHKALINFIENVAGLLDYKPGTTVVSVTTMSFDIFVFEIFPSLARGLKIVVANEQQQKIPELLSELIIKEKVEKILTTPSRMHLLAFGQSNIECFNVLKEIVLGGEPFPQKLLERLKSITNARIINMYGPTEATVYCTFKDLTHTDDINIGKALDNYKIYILDKYLNPMPIGVQGELCIGGESLARAYLNRDELTREKFVPNPFEPGTRIYKTGDLARWYPQGEIECLGRMDNQVKIRGYRIELGEIEEHLLKQDGVEKAVVIDREDINGRKYICAYLVCDNDVTDTQLKTALSQELPSYMVPSSFIRLDKLPLNPNGKVDRQALPEPEIGLKHPGRHSKPRNDVDRKLIEIWSKVLNVKGIGIDDDFFDIGGDSLSIIEIQMEMLKYNWNLNTQEFYKYSTIRELSNRILGIIKDSDEFSSEQEIAATTAVINNDAPIEVSKGLSHYKGIFLTGATGYLGIHILRELLSCSSADIYCIVRGQSDGQAKRRLMDLMDFYFPGGITEAEYKRLFIIRGDICNERFGLDEQSYSNLGKRVGLAIHAAAIVKYFGDYEVFKRTNVFGTGVVADFCLEFDIPFAHISTLGISGNYLVEQSQNCAAFTEKDFYVGQRYMENVYIRSKFEAENLVYNRMSDGLKAGIFRVGNLTGRYNDGYFQHNADENAFYNILRSFIKLGAVSKEIFKQRVEFTPVDCCSRAIVRLLSIKNFTNRVFHVFNHNIIEFRDMLDMFNALGINIKVMETEEFSQYIHRVALDDTKKKNIAGIVNNLSKKKMLNFSASVNIDSRLTVNILKDLGFIWPEIDVVYIDKILKYMKSSGYLK
ncbi:MAG TPA: amino acid adenylation domain-containing protein [Clostridiales bacterium]|nr:amino acid adenylation domain-containing protein [Clostridiales bacterium]